MAKYIDLDASSNGSGTQASPYNSFTELNALSGDQSSETWYIKRDNDYRGNIALDTVSNLHISTYGTGNKPIIRGSILVTDTWVSDQGAWYIPSTAEYMLVLPFVQDRARRNNTSIASLATWEQYFDSGNNRLYLKTDGTDPNDLPIEINNASSKAYVVELLDCNNVTVTNIHVIGGYMHGFLSWRNGAATIQDTGFYGCVAEYVGWRHSNISGTGADLGNCFTINANTTNNTGHAVIGCTGRYSDWNFFEMSYLNGAVARDNTARSLGGNCYELWNSTANSLFERTTAHDVSKIWWLSDDATVSAHDTNTLRNCVATSLYGQGIKIDAGTGNKIYNNSIHAITNNVVVGLPAAGTVDMQNNVFIQSDYTDQGTVWLQQGVVGSTINNNIWYRTDGTATFFTTGGNLGLSGWNTAISGTDKEGAPGVTNYESDMTLTGTGVLAAYDQTSGTAGLVTSDLTNQARYGGIDIGAIQLKRHTNVSVNTR